jgi:NADPH-dependent 2,4-dienoyl-CoA reductase/sulfur reductase-like enzyme
MGRSADVVVVGGGIAGLTVVETLRAREYTGGISWVGEEPHPPYNRPALSKQVLLGEWGPDDAFLLDRSRLEGLDAARITGVRATGLDLASRRVGLGTDWLDFGSLVIATGLSARSPIGIDGAERARVLRTLEDAAALAAALREGGRVAILGTGILGCEIASAARKLGLEATLVGRRPEIGVRVFGDRIAARIEALLRENGVDLLLGTGSVTLTGGDEVEADVVVAAIGSDPQTDWLAQSGLDVSDGVLCDHLGRAAPGVYAVGDVARWRHAQTGTATRTEHQMAAIEQAQIVAGCIVGERPEQAPDPLFWTELFGTRILAHGTFPAQGLLDVLEGDVEAGRFVAAHRTDGDATGLVGWNMPRAFRLARAASLRGGAAA